MPFPLPKAQNFVSGSALSIEQQRLIERQIFAESVECQIQQSPIHRALDGYMRSHILTGRIDPPISVFIMDTITPGQIVAFLKRFRFRGGIVRGFRVRNQQGEQAHGIVLVTVVDTESNRPVRLRLEIAAVDEYRFQRRPGGGLFRLREVRIGYFSGLMFLNLDAYPDDGPPALHDFRASDAYIGGRAISWQIIPPKAPSPS